MASVVTVVSRFCYRSPTRPLFVAALIFLILITWKFLTAQPDANALMMHSKHGIVSEKASEQHLVHKLHVPLQSPVKKQDSKRRLVNRLDKNGETKEAGHHGKVYDDEENAVHEKQSSDDVTSLKGDARLQKRKHKLLDTDKSKSLNDNIYDEEESKNDRKDENKENKSEEKDGEETKANTHSGVVNNKKGKMDSKAHLLTQLPSEHGLHQATKSTETIIDTKNKPQATNDTRLKDFLVGKYNILLTLVNMSPTSALATGVKKCLRSICRHSTIQLTVHVVCDDIGKMVVQEFFNGMTGKCKESEVVYHDVGSLTRQLAPITRALQEFFSSGNSYYNNPIFFMSTALYKVFPPKLTKVIMLDVDMRFFSDIKLLFDMFHNFKESNIMGIAREQSPVYRHILYAYRAAHKNTLLGEPPPNGATGFNSGVVLFNLEKMRKSTTYNNALNHEKLKELTEKYHFKGHLGDQDFFTLLSFEYPDLFYTIPCSWNRQLCLYWKENGYREVFDLYNNCSQTIHVYHGNCRTDIPGDDKKDQD